MFLVLLVLIPVFMLALLVLPLVLLVLLFVFPVLILSLFFRRLLLLRTAVLLRWRTRRPFWRSVIENTKITMNFLVMLLPFGAWASRSGARGLLPLLVLLRALFLHPIPVLTLVFLGFLLLLFLLL